MSTPALTSPTEHAAPAPVVEALPPREDVVIRYLLERRAAADERLVTFEDGSTWSTKEALAEAYAAANVLRAAGVRQGDVVAVLLPNGKDFLRAWWGIASLGAVLAGCNTAWKGLMLEYAIGLVEPKLVISSGDLADRVRSVAPDAELLDPAALADGGPEAPELERPIEPWDVHHLQFTSGTTGPSKAAVNSCYQFYLTGSWATVEAGLGQDDVFLIDLPLFHQGALSMAATCLATGTGIVVRSMPAMSTYWEVAAETGATMGFLLSTMAGFLLAAPERPAEREHKLRMMIAAPLPEDLEAFQERFGVAELITAYGSTEVSGPLIRLPGQPLVPGSCGAVRPGYEVRLVDEHDQSVPDGRPGELVVRTDQPWMLTQGYLRNAEATAEAWRNGWFHTGDLLVRSADGTYAFCDRTKDALRRRGENISSFEVEREVAAHDGVAQVICCAAQVEGQVDDEVKVWIVPTAEAELDFVALATWLFDRMPHFMVPRFYETIDALPMTETMKVQKHVLKDRGNGPETFDLEVAGWRITRNGLVSKAG